MLSQIAGAVALSVAAAALPSAALATPSEPAVADLYIGAFHEPIRKVIGDGEGEIVDPSRDVAAFTADRFGGLIMRTRHCSPQHRRSGRISPSGHRQAAADERALP
ncbi:hypothetical protein [Agromyces aerolatus]|uniref:hypothetical protein n=1 Tax=Agromyces sp. LY-1074 TaxID=3074080 RepID=UPI00285F048E|nr:MULTISPECIES: hypothetical protein [unclassified Agromyces]MDR5701655.1 hypothetical protein [Agromyces sp. LY-1074]MDR5707905.1 hypothetical protein [Agromyces sp. LY-1358]